jgi:hypothetical protein
MRIGYGYSTALALGLAGLRLLAVLFRLEDAP